MMVKISIVIPVYNTEKYLADCLDSVLKQTFSDYEVICINDASVDRSLDILNSYRNKFKNMSIIQHSENRGLSAARNTGIKQARGKYLMFLDSDDMLEQETIETLYDAAEEKQAEIIYFNCKVFYEKELGFKNNNVMITPHRGFNGTYTGKQLLYKYMEVDSINYSAACKFYKKEFIESSELYFYEGILHEDVLYSFYCFMNSERVICLDNCFYLCRKRRDSITTTVDNRRAESWFLVSMEIYKYWSAHSFDRKTELSIAWYFEKTFRAYLRYSKYCDENAGGIFARLADKKLYELIGSIGDARYAFLADEKIKRLKSANAVIVYGAGTVSGEIIGILVDKGIEITAVAVSSVLGNADRIEGIEVKPIQELIEYRNQAVVVIAVMEKYVEEIEGTLLRYGFKEIIKVDYIKKDSFL